eukprot:jgi/Ulvmu1/1040/UM104_0026.1
MDASRSACCELPGGASHVPLQGLLLSGTEQLMQQSVRERSARTAGFTSHDYVAARLKALVCENANLSRESVAPPVFSIIPPPVSFHGRLRSCSFSIHGHSGVAWAECKGHQRM